MFSAAQAYPFGAEFACEPRVGWCIGVGAHAEGAFLIGPFHKFAERVRLLGRNRWHTAGNYLARPAIECDVFATLNHAVTNLHRAFGVINLDHPTACYATFAHPSGHDRGVAGHAA